MGGRAGPQPRWDRGIVRGRDLRRAVARDWRDGLHRRAVSSLRGGMSDGRSPGVPGLARQARRTEAPLALHWHGAGRGVRPLLRALHRRRSVTLPPPVIPELLRRRPPPPRPSGPTRRRPPY